MEADRNKEGCDREGGWSDSMEHFRFLGDTPGFFWFVFFFFCSLEEQNLQNEYIHMERVCIRIPHRL